MKVSVTNSSPPSSPEGQAFDGLLQGVAIDEVAGFIRRIEKPPGWLIHPGSFVDVVHELNLVLRRDELVAVLAPKTTLRYLLKEMDAGRITYLARLAPTLFEAALLQGETRGLWLRGTHRRSAAKADTKNLGGRQLEESLDPAQDSSYALNAGKAQLPDDENRKVLVGTVGTTPGDSSVWFKACTDLRMFASGVGELLRLLDETTDSDENRENLSLLSHEVKSVEGVWGAYDVGVADLDLDHSAGGDADEGLAADAVTLQEGLIKIHGRSGAPNFLLDVGNGGSRAGGLLGSMAFSRGRCTLAIGIEDGPGDPVVAQKIRDAARSTELLKIYYRSGHTYSDGRLWKSRRPRGGFSHWDFRDFTGYDIMREKPAFTKWQEIHDEIGSDGSLFSWVSKNFSTGWLTCDDGSGEVGDFLHLDTEYKLTIIHVKGAHSDSPQRGISTSSYEVVAGQASKNTLFLDRDRLAERLKKAPVAKPACWVGGVKVPDRSEFITAYSKHDASSSLAVVIVQPHVSKTMLDRIQADVATSGETDEVLRLYRLEELLRGSYSKAAGSNAELSVIGSLI